MDFSTGTVAYRSNMRDFWIYARGPSVIHLEGTYGVERCINKFYCLLSGRIFLEHSKVRPTLFGHVDSQK